MNQTFEDFWKQYERRLWRIFMKAWGGFFRMNSGAWEDAFGQASIVIFRKWGTYKGEVSRDAWALGVMRNVFLVQYRNFKRGPQPIGGNRAAGGGLGNDEDEPDPFGNIPDTSTSLDEIEYEKLIASIDDFAEQCAKKFTSGKRTLFTSVEKNVLAVFYMRVQDDLTGAEVQERTRHIKEPGMKEPQQTQVVQAMKKCIAESAIRAGFGDVINY